MSSPLVSVCMPTFNRDQYLAEAIDSVVGQTEKDWELVVVDDGSTDSTPVLMKWYEERDLRIRYHRGVENQGIAKARNLAVSLSKGRYIAVMDSDDLMGPDRLKKSLRVLEKGADIAYSPYLQADNDATVVQGVMPAKKLTRESLLKDQGIPHVTVTAKRKCFLEHPYKDNLKVNDDYELIWDWFNAGYRFQMVKDPLMIVRYHDTNVSRTEWEAIKEVNEELRERMRNG